MNKKQELTLLLVDACEQTIVNPGASHNWHRMAKLCSSVEDPGLLDSILALLMSNTPSKGVAGFLRATFMAWVVNNLDFVAEAGRLVQTIEPMDPGRLMAFMVYEWGRLLREPSRPRFIQSLRDAQLHKITNRVGQHLSQCVVVRPASRNILGARKVAVIAPYLSNTDHTPTLFCLNQVKLLAEQGLAVHLFSSQELNIPDMPHYLGNQGAFLNPPPDHDQLRALLPANLSVTLSDERFSLVRRWADMLKAIASYDPDLVLFVGLFSPLLQPLYEVRPVLGLCVHSVPPLAPVDVWLTAHQELADRPSDTWAPELPAALGCYHPYRIALKPTAALLQRADLGLPEQARVLVTAGHRLPHEINGTWAARMLELLRQQPDVVWLLVGGDGTLPVALADAPAQQLRVLANHPDLRSVYRCCDVYVNPPRMGGGFSVAEAMAESLPVVAYADSDGGHKVGAGAVNEDDDYFALLGALLRDAGLRQRTGVAMRAHFTSTLDLAQSGPSLLAACELTLERYRQRAN